MWIWEHSWWNENSENCSPRYYLWISTVLIPRWWLWRPNSFAWASSLASVNHNFWNFAWMKNWENGKDFYGLNPKKVFQHISMQLPSKALLWSKKNKARYMALLQSMNWLNPSENWIRYLHIQKIMVIKSYIKSKIK
jgi:hypothetical protein